MSTQTATIDVCATKTISADEAWRYEPGERSMMIEAGYTFENFPASSNEKIIANPEWHTAKPEELVQQGICFRAWALVHAIMSGQPSQRNTFTTSDQAIAKAVNYLQQKAEQAPDPNSANAIIALIRSQLANIFSDTEVAA